MRNAHLVQTLVNINRNTKRHPEGFPLKDFLLIFGDTPKPEKKQSWQEQKRIAQLHYMESQREGQKISRAKKR